MYVYWDSQEYIVFVIPLKSFVKTAQNKTHRLLLVHIPTLTLHIDFLCTSSPLYVYYLCFHSHLPFSALTVWDYDLTFFHVPNPLGQIVPVWELCC